MLAATLESRMASIRVGSRFGRLEVVGEGEPYVWRGRVARRRWACVCDCGNETEVRDDRLKAGTTRSCGCLVVESARDRQTRHGGRAGGRALPEYQAWQALLHRSADVTVCRRWRAGRGLGFQRFLDDMGPRPGPDHRLVRPDPTRAFGPGNCQWRSGVPRRGVPRRFISYRGRQLTLKAAAAATGISYERLCKRLERGWPENLALRP
jgi:hypothetical protein